LKRYAGTKKGQTRCATGPYFQASRILQEAVKADDKFALAHARLAEAYIALDNSDGAKDELLAIQPAMANASSLSKLDALRLNRSKCNGTAESSGSDKRFQ